MSDPPARPPKAPWLALAAALSPALAAVWLVPGFVTQDGPTHLYNARILLASLRPGSPFDAAFAVHWQPLPNWSGHLATMALLTLLPPRTAGRLIDSATLVGLAASVLWLRGRVAGTRGQTATAPLAALLALNVAWLFGFTSFLIGSCLFAITLGLWWSWRDRLGPTRAAGLGVWLVLGYFSHPISLAATLLGLFVLTTTTPGPFPVRRAGWTAAALVPLVPLGFVYRTFMRRGGSIAPVWGHLVDPTSPGSWQSQLGWVDPISLGSKVIAPFVAETSPWFAWLVPALWLAVALGIETVGTIRRRRRVDPLRGWGLLALLLIVGGLVMPDTLGASHGNYLPQRVVLLGLLALVPYLEPTISRPCGRLAMTSLLLALGLQSAFVWDYARTSDRLVSPVLRAVPAIGRGDRVASLLVGIRGRYRANPLLHVDSLLGLEADPILWGNYETTHYYFPVQVLPDAAGPSAWDLEQLALLDSPGDAPARARLWRRLLSAHHARIDTLLILGPTPDLDPIHARWFRPVSKDGPVRVLRHREY
ncbi:MAG TPA: hypothetical protein VG406_24540 [Isosphaeraceae bacterium]|jgi:hypothetical protein|nr:hypothetical protein [Isosphaeraceae bacterium]